MPNYQPPTSLPITTAEQAIARGNEFLSRYSYYFRRPVSARQEANQWVVMFDVSIVGPKQIIRLNIDPETGAITELEGRDNQ